jgi:DNA-binding NtrC family response regulator
VSRLLVTHGHHFGVCYDLLETTTLGRSSGCTIQLLDEKVSRQHTSVLKRGDRWVLKDEGSSNGTGLNGRLLLESQELTPGDEVAIGNNLMLFDPDLEILRDLEGAGAVVLAARGDATVPPPIQTADDASAVQPFQLEALLSGVADMLGGPRGVGRPAALVEAVTRGLGAERGALLLAPTGDEPMKAVATYPHRGRVTVTRDLVHRVLEKRVPAVTTDGVLELTVRAGRSMIEAHAGAALAIPILHGGRIRGVYYADTTHRGGFSTTPIDRVQAIVTITFTRMLAGPPEALRPPREPTPHAAPVAQSPAMQAVLQQAQAWAETTDPLLLRGEPGSGRSFLAGWIHSISPRSQGPFVVARCGTLAEAVAESTLFGHERGALAGADTRRLGLLEEADGGTLLLDGVSELSPPLQVKLLRALQEGRFYRVGGTRPVRVDLRVLAGTRRDLPAMVAESRFRQDLYEILSALRLDLPPLRRRLADIEPLAQACVADFNANNGTRMKGLTPESVGLVETHDWPGNLRELRATINRLLVGAQGTWVEARQVEEELATHPSSSSYGTDTDIADLLRQRERRWLSAAMDRARGHRGRAARMLELPTEELERLLALHAVDDFGR